MPSLKPSTQPVAYSAIVQAVLAALVATGWAVIPDTTINAVASAFGLILAGVAAAVARGKVTPTALIKDAKAKALEAAQHLNPLETDKPDSTVKTTEEADPVVTQPAEPTAPQDPPAVV